MTRRKPTTGHMDTLIDGLYAMCDGDPATRLDDVLAVETDDDLYALRGAADHLAARIRRAWLARVQPKPTGPCEHTDFDAEIRVNRITATDGGPVTGYSADITVECRCGLPFEWIGPPLGVNPAAPTVSVNGQELRAPLKPATAPAGFGLCLPSVGIRFPEGEPGA